MCELLEHLKSEGFNVCATEHGFILGHHAPLPAPLHSGNLTFWVVEGKVQCPRGCFLNLAIPDSLDTLVESLTHCERQKKCEKCPMGGKLPIKLTNDLYHFIGWACKTNCEELCGRFGLYHCPLK